MKVLMFGWEYPPHVFGGLATANYGISEGLKAQGDIETVLCLPHPFGDESQHACRIVAMNAVPIAWRDVDRDYVQQRVGNISEHDMFNTFNMGVGMVVAVAEEDADKALRVLQEAGEDAVVLGEVIEGSEGVVFA